ncbi:DNA cytosine methyltransferase [Taibaiella soli]|uniref:Uncharacterized protein n=1 Tax=Taibaiella soli TaxID=1649169 RepID=A0A2W2AK08_9BACT|nr:DNA cytosine methyltransferase [Taibaiella soli]PZF72580.1 hypothetical protein DN068_11995 [Taibaiella soli]
MEYPELTVASVFCSGGIGMTGYVDAGFTPVYAADLEKQPLEIFDANFRYSNGASVTHQENAELLIGSAIRQAVRKLTGSDTIHLLEQGPSCHDYTGLQLRGDFGRRTLMLDALRLIEEVQPMVAVIEEVPKFLLPKHKDVSDEYFARLKKMNYRSAYRIMNTVHYESNQSRERYVHIFVHNELGIDPIFPEPILGKEKRVKDFLDVDHFFSGHFSDKIKTKNHFMCTVTSGSPEWFAKGGIKWEPTDDELKLCMDLDPKKYKSASTKTAMKQAVGNGIPAKLTYHIGKTIIDQILRLEQKHDGTWVGKK